MGGLLARQVLSDPAVRKYVDYIVPIASPHQGSVFGDLGTNLVHDLCKASTKTLALTPMLQRYVTKERCAAALRLDAMVGLSVGSRQLKKLPSFPADLPVRVIAGDVTVRTKSVFGDFVNDTESDLVVGFNSATRYSGGKRVFTSQYAGDGLMTFQCESPHGIPGLTDAPCEHSNLLRNPKVHADVIRGLKQWAAGKEQATALPPKPPGRPYVMFQGQPLATVILPDTWSGMMSEPGWVNTFADRSGSCRDLSNADCPGVAIFGLRPSAKDSNGDGVHDNVAVKGTRASVAPSGCIKVTVGGKTTKTRIGGASAVRCERRAAGQTHYSWYVPGKDFLVTASQTDGGSKLDLVLLEHVLAYVKWLR